MSESGMERFTRLSPVLIAASTSARVMRHQAIASAFDKALPTAAISSISRLPIAGVPASISSTPAASRASAIASFSSSVNATPGACSPSLSVESLITTRDTLGIRCLHGNRADLQIAHCLLEDFDNSIHIVIRIIARKREAHRSAQMTEWNLHRSQHMGWIERTRHAGRSDRKSVG